MRKNGFTLIELLAVIVILAIIALIATPIILGIINDAREESNERSVDLYAAAVKNGIAAYQLIGTSAPKSFSDLTIQYDGDVKCSVQELYEDGSFYIADCEVNGTAVDYTYGTKQEIVKTILYSFSSEPIKLGNVVDPNAALFTTNPTTLGKSAYLKHALNKENKVVESFICFVREGIEYCLEGATDDSVYKTNINIIKEAFKDIINTESCYFETDYFECFENGLDVIAHSNGPVTVDGPAYCFSDETGNFVCSG